ncbi:MAG: prepilin-type N-terminal cleavage/methylation domain-containing protein [Microcystaceae cyanobacterium]
MKPLIRLSSRHQGLTMTEVLMAMLVSSIILAATAPILLLSASLRIQNDRAGRAVQLAQSEIDRLQVLVTQGVLQDDEQGKIPPPIPDGEIFNTYSPPTSTVKIRQDLTDPKQALELDTNGDEQPDFLIQLFRDEGIRFDQGSGQDQLAVFRVGVRVYSGVAKNNLGSLETELAAVSFNEGIGQQQTHPIAILYTEMSRSDLKLSLQKYREYLESNQ